MTAHKRNCDFLGPWTETGDIDSETIAAFADGLKKKLTDSDRPGLRKIYVQAFVNEVVMTKSV